MPVLLLYPLVPWVGVMALGYVAGPLIFSRAPGAVGRLAWIGAVLLAGFVLLRTLNGYGDPAPAHRRRSGHPAISFLDLTKYPPSLGFVLMTLGPALLALALAGRVRGRVARALVTFGRVPFLFYVAHLYLVHSLAVLAAVAQGLPAPARCGRLRSASRGLRVRAPGHLSRSGSPWSRCSIRCAPGTPS